MSESSSPQADLFDARVERFLARRSDPPTAKEAAFVSGRNRDSLAIALKWLRRFLNGATYREIAAAAREEIEDRNFFSRRLPTLRDMGLARNGPDRECSIGRTKMQTWLPVGAGSAIVAPPPALPNAPRQERSPRRCTHTRCNRFGRRGACLYGDSDDLASRAI